MRKALRQLGLLLVLACSLQPAASNPAAPAEHHTLWSLKGKTNVVYLLGSVHFLKPAEQLPPVVDAAYREAEAIVMEIDMDDLDTEAMRATMLDLGTLPADRTLEQELGAATYARVRERAEGLGLEPLLLNRLRPWLAAMRLSQLQLMKMGLNPESGVEQRLTTQAVRDRKPITGLETVDQQLGMLATLPDRQQREFLMYSVEEADHATQEIDELIAAWRSGDTQGLARVLAEDFERYPDLYRPLMVDRNRRWIASIEALLDEKEDYLVVVGALHLVGRDSVIDLLEREGHRVTQH
jgi:uncharacterized protein YbaP (TraB family)